MQLEDPTEAYLPATQETQIEVPTTDEYEPAAQLVQDAAFATLYFPISQEVQEDEPAKLYNPPAHIEQVIEPLDAE